MKRIIHEMELGYKFDEKGNLRGFTEINMRYEKFVIVELCKQIDEDWPTVHPDYLWFEIELYEDGKRKCYIETGFADPKEYERDFTNGSLDDIKGKLMEFVKYLLKEF